MKRSFSTMIKKKKTSTGIFEELIVKLTEKTCITGISKAAKFLFLPMHTSEQSAKHFLQYFCSLRYRQDTVIYSWLHYRYTTKKSTWLVMVFNVQKVEEFVLACSGEQKKKKEKKDTHTHTNWQKGMATDW